MKLRGMGLEVGHLATSSGSVQRRGGDQLKSGSPQHADRRLLAG